MENLIGNVAFASAGILAVGLAVTMCAFLFKAAGIL